MSENIYRAAWSLAACVAVTVAVSLFTKPKPEAELDGLVFGLTEIPSEGHYPVLKRPIFWAAVIAILFLAINIALW
jgi:SSS family solute:Na+ symporter